jgi:ornithine cyclodeaminase/alanine dehydrogenase-like protein (mu-crystallin family)
VDHDEGRPTPAQNQRHPDRFSIQRTRVQPCGTDPERAVAEADVVTAATGSSTPVFDGRWLRPGTHINGIGSNFAQKQELDAHTVRRAQRIVVDDMDVARLECGDLLHPDASAGLDWSTVHTLADVVGGFRPPPGF